MHTFLGLILGQPHQNLRGPGIYVSRDLQVFYVDTKFEVYRLMIECQNLPDWRRVWPGEDPGSADRKCELVQSRKLVKSFDSLRALFFCPHCPLGEQVRQDCCFSIVPKPIILVSL